MENKGNGGLMANHLATITDRREFLVNNELMSDVIFVVGKDNQIIYAHKQFLITASDYFYVMFEGNFRESKDAEIPLEDIEWSILKEILRYMYSGKVNLNSENVRDIFIHSKKFLLSELLDEISEFFVQNVTPQSALESLSQNRFYEFQNVDDKCLEFIGDNPFHYLSDKNIAKIDYDSLKVIVKIRKINCSDRQLLYALQNWQKANPGKNTDGLKAYMKRKARFYHCQRLQLFGPLTDKFQINRNAGLKIVIRSESSVYLHGIGVIVAKKGSIRIILTTSSACVHDQTYDVDEKEGMPIMDCFFPKCVLSSKSTYTINLTGTGLNPLKRIESPNILYDQFLTLAPFDGSQVLITNIAYLYCNARPLI